MKFLSRISGLLFTVAITHTHTKKGISFHISACKCILKYEDCNTFYSKELDREINATVFTIKMLIFGINFTINSCCTIGKLIGTTV